MADETAVTIHADDAEEAFFATAHMLRGSIITSFSHAEFLFADLYYRTLRLPEYAHLPKHLSLHCKITDQQFEDDFFHAGSAQKI